MTVVNRPTGANRSAPGLRLRAGLADILIEPVQHSASAIALITLALGLGCGEIREVPVSVDEPTEGTTAGSGTTQGVDTEPASATSTPDNDDSPPPMTTSSDSGSSGGAELVPEPFCVTPSVPIPDDGKTAEATLQIPSDTTLDLTVGLRIQHPRLSDLRVELISPDDTVVLLLDEAPCAGANANVFFDDTARSDAAGACTPGGKTALEGTVTPAEPLGPLLEGTIAGLWTVRVQDVSPTNEGIIDGWCLTLYGEG